MVISMSRGVPLGCVAPSAFSPVIQSEAKNLGFLGKHLPFLLNTSRICGLKQLRGEVISVSYTHLDVYKRQVHNYDKEKC